MAPEVIKGTVCQSPHGWKQADVWSLGCTVIEMLTGRMPWTPKFQNPIAAMYVLSPYFICMLGCACSSRSHASDDITHRYQIANGHAPPLDRPDASPAARAFVQLCCRSSPDQRCVHH